MHCKWMTNDMKPLNEFIHWGNTLKMDFTEKDLHEFQQTQLNAILSILAEYKSNNTIRWANIRSWISLVIAILSFLFSLVTCK